jgi:hypothetical protein
MGDGGGGCEGGVAVDVKDVREGLNAKRIKGKEVLSG